jgi:hypothetical protein
MGAPHRYAGPVSDTQAQHHGKGTQTAICVYLIRTGAEVANVQSEEPGAGKLHAGICAGGRPERGVPTAMLHKTNLRFTRGMRRGMVHTVEIEKTEEQTHDHSSRR